MDEIIDFINGKSVAVIGNATSLFNKHWSKEIDSHNLVWRMNKGVNLSPNQIEKTTNRCEIYSAGGPRGCAKTCEFTTNLPKYSIFMSSNEANMGRCPKHFYKIPIIVLRELKEILYFETDKKEVAPSTGLIVIYFLLKQTDVAQVTIFGFDFFKTKTFYRGKLGHYGSHRPKREKELFDQLVKEDKRLQLCT